MAFACPIGRKDLKLVPRNEFRTCEEKKKLQARKEEQDGKFPRKSQFPGNFRVLQENLSDFSTRENQRFTIN